MERRAAEPLEEIRGERTLLIDLRQIAIRKCGAVGIPRSRRANQLCAQRREVLHFGQRVTSIEHFTGQNLEILRERSLLRLEVVGQRDILLLRECGKRAPQLSILTMDDAAQLPRLGQTAAMRGEDRESILRRR